MKIGRAFKLFSKPHLYAPPVFILGCGRSGTTILGTVLSKHSQITYLNERRDLWSAAYPETDIWSKDAKALSGRMVLGREDCNPRSSRKLVELFAREVQETGRPVLVEKLPINNFRLLFINAIFPKAKYIHIFRNGLEVAHSIEERCRKGGWYGADNYKWKQLADLADSIPATARLSQTCAGDYEKGLLEWRLSTGHAVSFLSTLPADRFLEVSYGKFVADPSIVTKKIVSFLGLEIEDSMEAYLLERVQRKSVSRDESVLSEAELRIGGRLLEMCLHPSDTITDQCKRLGSVF